MNTFSALHLVRLCKYDLSLLFFFAAFSVWYLISSCVHSVPGDVWQSRQSQPCLALPLWRSSSGLSASRPIFLQRASGFIGIHRPCQQPASVCYILLLITDGTDPSVNLTGHPISQPLLCGSSSQVYGGGLAGYELIQLVNLLSYLGKMS